jgi:hypothetical protein
MTQQHLVIPPELIEHWLGDFWPRDALQAAAQWGYEQHEKELLYAMHSVVPQTYEPEAK